MSVSESTAERVNLEYQGSTLRTALWLLVTGVISIPIVTAAWAAAFLYRRILPQISFTDGTRATFQDSLAEYGVGSLLAQFSPRFPR